MLGGIGRLVANESVFRIFAMEHLWSGDPFFVYKGIIRGSILGLLLFFIVSLWTGLATGLGLQYFLIDSIFSLFLVVLLYLIQKD